MQTIQNNVVPAAKPTDTVPKTAAPSNATKYQGVRAALTPSPDTNQQGVRAAPSSSSTNQNEGKAATDTVYIGGIHPDTSTAVLTKHIEDMGIKCVGEPQVMSKPNFSRKSFKVCVPAEAGPIIMHADNWPAGVILRPFRHKGTHQKRHSPKGSDNYASHHTGRPHKRPQHNSQGSHRYHGKHWSRNAHVGSRHRPNHWSKDNRGSGSQHSWRHRHNFWAEDSQDGRRHYSNHWAEDSQDYGRAW